MTVGRRVEPLDRCRRTSRTAPPNRRARRRCSRTDAHFPNRCRRPASLRPPLSEEALWDERRNIFKPDWMSRDLPIPPSLLGEDDATCERRLLAVGSREVSVDARGLCGSDAAECPAATARRVELAMCADSGRWAICRRERSGARRIHRQPWMRRTNRRPQRLHVRLRHHFKRPCHVTTRRWRRVRIAWIDLNRDGAAPGASQKRGLAGRSGRRGLSATARERGSDKDRDRQLRGPHHTDAPSWTMASQGHGSTTNRSTCGS